MTHSPLSPVSIAKPDLERLNRQFNLANPNRILAWCVENIPTGLVQTSAFNVDDMVITDLLYRALKPVRPIPVVFLDTLHHFPETLELVAHARAFYHLNLQTYQVPEISSQAAFAQRYGANLWETDLAQFHYLTKIEPLQRGLADLKTVAWITGRRRDQSAGRADMPVFELDSQNRLKINPLASWTRRDSWAYIFEHDVMYNPLHDQGHASIGDAPITTPTQADEDERDGGWQDNARTECEISL